MAVLTRLNLLACLLKASLLLVAMPGAPSSVLAPSSACLLKAWKLWFYMFLVQGFIASDEAGAGPFHKQRVLSAGYADTVRTTIYTGRPMRRLDLPKRSFACVTRD